MVRNSETWRRLKALNPQFPRDLMVIEKIKNHQKKSSITITKEKIRKFKKYRFFLFCFVLLILGILHLRVYSKSHLDYLKK